MIRAMMLAVAATFPSTGQSALVADQTVVESGTATQASGIASATTTLPVESDFDATTGYRVAHYRAVVPAPPEGVPRIDAAKVVTLMRTRRAVLIDVMPAEGGVRDPVTGDWRLAQPRDSIAGAAWFPEAGRGLPDPGIAQWFAGGIASLRGKADSRPLIVFCLADCWMSWNAARRLSKAGYREVYWFADGTDGWAESGGALVRVQPFGTPPP